ncbi:MAG TPA: hypothetical protein VGM88_11930 [Kofleriaceae bacterium]
MPSEASEHVWALVLGRGESEALDEVCAIATPANTLVVVNGDPADAARELAGRADHVLAQPSWRGTGLAAYVALSMIRRWTPHAVVVMLPGELTAEPDARFADHVRCAGSVAVAHRDAVVVVDGDGEPGHPIFAYPGLRRISSYPRTSRLPVIAGTVEALWRLGHATQAHLLDILESLVPIVGTPEESEAIEYIYRAYLPVCMTRDILHRAPDRLYGLPLDAAEAHGVAAPHVRTASSSALAAASL